MGGFEPVGALLPAAPKRMSLIKSRLLDMPAGAALEILYQHSVLAQTSMPYRDPGSLRIWSRANGAVKLELQAGRILDPQSKSFVDVGLPFGPKPRLVLYHLNAEALRTRSPVIELGDSLTAFVQRLGLAGSGRDIRTVREQLVRLAAADFRLGMCYGRHAVTIPGRVITGLELWAPKDPAQRSLWPTRVKFSTEYFESLLEYAVPLNEQAVIRLSHSAAALDIYCWLAQRAHRVPKGSPAFIPWVSLKEQFGAEFGRLVDFRRFFSRTLKEVRCVYPDVQARLDGKGLSVGHSLPPVRARLPG
jgi:hypothetical protein